MFYEVANAKVMDNQNDAFYSGLPGQYMDHPSGLPVLGQYMDANSAYPLPGQYLEPNSVITLPGSSTFSPYVPAFFPRGFEFPERYSRKVFVGGLPPDIDEEEIIASFMKFGILSVDWPHKRESRSYFPPKGYAFLLFEHETAVHRLVESCVLGDGNKLYYSVSSPSVKNKNVQVRPWRLMDADYALDKSMPLDPRQTVFVGGVPRPLKAQDLAAIMERLYGGVCYVGIDTDPDLKYPKGAARVAFTNQTSYLMAVNNRYIQIKCDDIDKRVEVKPYELGP